MTFASSINWVACVAEFVAMVLFVIIGCGSAMGIAGVADSAWVLQVSLTFGFAITSLAYSIGHFSGGHINCAVTLGLVLTGHCERNQGLANLGSQLLGSLTGALFLCLVVPKDADRTHGLGSNGVSEKFSWMNAFIGEVMMTFLLVFVVLQTACHPKSASNRPQACIAIGFAVFLAHTVLIPIDGCSINPTRSFGPALVASIRYPESSFFKDMWIFWAGPLTGAAAAAGVWELLKKVFPESMEPAAPAASQVEYADEEYGGEKSAMADARPSHVVMNKDLDDIEVDVGVAKQGERRKSWRERWFGRSSDSADLAGVVPGRKTEQELKGRAPSGHVLCGGSAPTEDGDSFACCMFFKNVVVA